VPLLLSRSFYGDEDIDLERRLEAELPGILNWSLDGLVRLTDQGRFTRPPATDEVLRTLQDLASPVQAFVRDMCALDPQKSVSVDGLYTAWRFWAGANGHRVTSKQTFGRDLRAANPQIKVAQLGARGDRQRFYVGISTELEPS
jgi:putative DNA primase/helicase